MKSKIIILFFISIFLIGCEINNTESGLKQPILEDGYLPVKIKPKIVTDYIYDIDGLNFYQRIITNWNNSHINVFFGDSRIVIMFMRNYFIDQNSYSFARCGGRTAGIINRLGNIKTLQSMGYIIDNVILQSGANDLISELGFENFKNNYQIIINELKIIAPNAKIIIQDLVVYNGLTNDNINILKQHNIWLNQFTIDNNIYFVEINPVFSDENNKLKSEFNLDGIHYTGYGYRYIMMRFAEVLNFNVGAIYYGDFND